MPPHNYIVRLYFAEHEQLKPGQRVFSVTLQDHEVLRDLDIVGETGEPNIGLIKECQAVKASDVIRVRLIPTTGKTLLCGVEVIAHDP